MVPMHVFFLSNLQRENWFQLFSLEAGGNPGGLLWLFYIQHISSSQTLFIAYKPNEAAPQAV